MIQNVSTGAVVQSMKCDSVLIFEFEIVLNDAPKILFYIANPISFNCMAMTQN
jgi:hypothetical protein